GRISSAAGYAPKQRLSGGVFDRLEDHGDGEERRQDAEQAENKSPPPRGVRADDPIEVKLDEARDDQPCDSPDRQLCENLAHPIPRPALISQTLAVQAKTCNLGVGNADMTSSCGQAA